MNATRSAAAKAPDRSPARARAPAAAGPVPGFVTTARRLGNAQMARALNVLGAAAGRTIHRACACGPEKESCDCPKIYRSATGPAPAGLPVSSPSDAREREAESIADSVMSMRVPDAEASAAATPAAASFPSIAPGGRALPASTRSWFEQRFGRDLSSVRVHVGADAESSAAALNARAYTVGRDIVFGAGHYAPETAAGRRLLAHEIGHVLQEGPGIARMIHRQACGHDGPKGSGCGRLQSEKDGKLVEVGADRVIAAALRGTLGGTWIAQAYSPPNPVKGGLNFGLIDAMKVTTGADLKLEVAEIKSRNTGEGTGGCALATSEAQGYVGVLAPLAPRMAKISQGLAKIGGLALPDCRSFNKKIEAQLRSAGIDPANPQDMFAWCVLNSIQNKLGVPFTKGFSKVSVSVATDGAVGTDYRALLMPYPCKKNKKQGIGVYQMIFQVNQKGGISYRCEKECFKQEEEEKVKEKYKDLTDVITLPSGQSAEKFKDVNVIDEPNPNENVDIREPEGGIDVVDVLIWSAAALAAAKALQLAKQKAKSIAEQKAAEAALKRIAQEAERRGAARIAEALAKKQLEAAEKKIAEELARAGEKRIQQALEKRLIEEAIKKATTEAEKKAATKAAQTLAKKSAQALAKKGPQAIPYIGAVIFIVVELGPMADAYAKGADIQFGISGSDADLSGDTKVDLKGDKSKTEVVSDVKLDDSQIDMEIGKPPASKGVVELEAKKVTMKGKLPPADGMEVTVNLTLKLENTTIVYKSIGKMKGGKVVIDGAMNIKDSTITIDIPADQQVDVGSQTGVKKEIKGANVTITKPGSGEGQGTGKGTVPGAGEKKEEKKEETPPDPDAAEKAKLVGEIKKDERLSKLYEQIFKKKGSPNVEVLRRLAALKAQLDAHPELLDKLLGKLEKAEGADPIKDLIEPLEQELANAARKVEPPKTPEVKPGAPPATTTTTPPAADDKRADDKKTESAEGAPKVEPSAEEKAKATSVSFWTNKDRKYGNWKQEEAPPKYTKTVKLPVTLTRKTAKGNREYKFWIHGTFVNELKAPPSYEWAANYKFTAPSGLIKSTQGDEPIYFSDGGVEKVEPIGYQPPPPAKSKKKK